MPWCLSRLCSRDAPAESHAYLASDSATWLLILQCGQYPLAPTADVQVQADGYAMVGEQLPIDCIVAAAGAVHDCRLAVTAKYREGTEVPTITVRGRSGEQHLCHKRLPATVLVDLTCES